MVPSIFSRIASFFLKNEARLRFTLRSKLVVFFSLLFALLSVFNYAYYPGIYKNQSVANIKNLVYQVSEMLALTAGISFELADFESLQMTLEWAKKDKRLAYLGIYDANNKEVAVFNPGNLNLDIKHMLAHKEIIEINNSLFMSAPIGYHDHSHGKLLLGLSLNELNLNITNNKINTLFISLMIFIFGLIGVLFLSNMILKPITQLANAANEVSKGNTEVEIEITTKDEIGDLGKCFQDMVYNIKKSIEGQVAAIVKTSEVLTRLSNEINNAVTRQVTVTNEQTSTVTEIAATVNELSISSSEVANKCTQVADTATDGLTHSADGMEAIGTLKDKMMEITDANDSSAVKVRDLGIKSNEIGNIMRIINDIADQTKLIAFNAAIEAASAGEAGKRFNVVASEVRRLASSITSSTEEIDQKIEEIQQLSQQLVIASQAESTRIEEGAELANNTVLKFEGLVQGAKSTHSAATQISVATQQQKTATEQVAIALREIEKGSYQSANAVKQISVAIAELTSLASELSQLVYGLSSHKKQKGEILTLRDPKRVVVATKAKVSGGTLK